MRDYNALRTLKDRMIGNLAKEAKIRIQMEFFKKILE